MSDLGEFGSPLPSYPTLPGSMEHHYGSDTAASDPASNRNAPPIPPGHPLPSAPDPSIRLRLATPDELGYPGLTQSPSVVPVRSGYNTSPQQQQHQHERYWTMQPQSGRNTEPDVSTQSLLASRDLRSLPMDDASNYYSLPPSNDGSVPTTSSNIPIYATVRKPHTSSPSLPEHSTTQGSTRQRTVSGSPFSGGQDFSLNQTQPVLTQSPPTSSLSSSITDSTSTLAIRVKHLESLCGKLSREKSDMEEAFGRQRKSFMNQMAHSDAQLTLCKQRVEKYSKEVQELSMQVMTKDEELQNVTIAAGITEATIRERFDAERVKYEEEIASLTKIVSVQSQDTNQAMQQEREVWQREKATLRAEIEQLKRGALGAASSPVGMVGRNSPLDQHAKSSSPNSEDDSLEISMTKAAEDAKLLRSVVVPLEEEICSLKAQLGEAYSKLEEANSKLTEQDAKVSLIDLEVSLASPMPSDPKELQGQLILARSACHDLEMHTSQLKMQKTVLQDEVTSLSEQLTRVSTDLEVEKLNCVELKRTWEMANAHFIVAQDKLKQEVYRLQQKLERGEAASPLREITIEDLPAPKMIERPQATKREELQPPRTHKRSWSTDEATEPPVAATLQRLKSASWNSLHKPDEAESLSSKTQALEEELSKTKATLKQQKQVCTSYEKQLQRVQEQMMADIEEKEVVIEKIRIENGKFKAHIMRQRQQYEKLCRQMDDLKEEMKTRIENFQTNEQDLKSQQRIVRDKFTELKHDTQREIAKMSEDRRDIHQQLQRAREEYDYLKTIQNSCVTDYQAQLADLKQTCEETESKLSRTTAQLSTKNDQLAQVREMLAAERSGKEKLNVKLTTQLEVAKKRIEELSPLVSKYETERNAREEVAAAKSVMEQKSRDFINDQKELIEKLNKDKEKAENHVLELQRQMASLKHKLNHTEETQKDFVELSQSLQMKLAVMEEEIQKNQVLQESLSSPST